VIHPQRSNGFRGESSGLITMAGSDTPKIPPLTALEQPEPLHSVMAAERPKDDCLPCRLTGSGAFIGLGVYSYYSGQAQLNNKRAELMKSKNLLSFKTRQMGISGIAMVLVGMGLYRLVN